MAEGTITPDLCVIGGGHSAGGMAIAAASLGLQVALVRNGGANRETPPPLRQIHALAAAARAIRGVRNAAQFGIDAGDPSVNFARLRQGAQAVLADLALNETDARLAALGVRIFDDGGSFTDPSTVVAGNREIRARRFLLAPSFSARTPEIRGLPKTSHLTAGRILDLREMPRHLVVIGAGATGLSLAQSFRRFGSKVTVLEKAEPLSIEDRDCVRTLCEALKREGIGIRSGVEIERVEGKKGELRISFREGDQPQTIEASHLLVATGWRMELGALGLELAKIETGADGIRVGANLRTSNPRVFAAVNGPDLPQADAWHARLTIANLMFRMPLRADAALVARATATDPGLAHAGLGEEAARGRHGRIQILRWPFAENGAAAIAREGEGMIKLVATQRGRLLGVTIVGAGAGELIGPYALAISKRMHLSALTGPVFPQPARGEIGQQAALAGLRGGLTSPWVRRIIAAMRWFG